MSLHILDASCPKDLTRKIVRKNAEAVEEDEKASVEKKQAIEIAKSISSQLPAWIQIIEKRTCKNVGSVFLEPGDCSSVIREVPWGKKAQEEKSISILHVFQFFISKSVDQIVKDDQKEQFLPLGSQSLDEDDTEEIARRLVSGDVGFLKDDDKFLVLLCDPRNAWDFEAKAGDVSGQTIKRQNFTFEDGLMPRPSPTFQPGEHNLAGVAKAIRKSKKITVLIGAGVSTEHICDFRSRSDIKEKRGLYQILEEDKELGGDLPTPESLFTLDFFSEKPDIFWRVSQAMKLFPPSKLPPTRVHCFLKLLEEKGKLNIVFTQNIDTLEKMAGLDPENVVAAHGDFATAHCTGKHKHAMTVERLEEIVVKEKKVPRCESQGCDAPVKPAVVFFGEQLPRRFFENIQKLKEETDLMLVIGSSLQVTPFANLADPPRGNFNKYSRILINMERAGAFTFIDDPEGKEVDPREVRDVFLKGDCQAAIENLAALLGWKNELLKAWNEGKKRCGWKVEADSEEQEEEGEKQGGEKQNENKK